VNLGPVGRHIFQRIAVTDDRVTDVDAYRVYAEALGGAGDPERTRGRKYHLSSSNTEP
jgi:hypothetical protein